MINIIGNAKNLHLPKGCITVRLERHLELENMALLSVMTTVSGFRLRRYSGLPNVISEWEGMS